MTDVLRKKIAAIPYWYHRIVLPGGVTTPGWAPIDPAAYNIPTDLTGHRVLDIGAWDGYWTFEALRRGAREVVAIDDFSDHLNQKENVPRRQWETFDLCRDAFGYGPDRVTRLEMNIYDVSLEKLGLFDTIFFFGTLYHLRYPLLALDKLSAICTKQIYVETTICDDFSPYRGGLGNGYPGNQMVMEFYPTTQLGDNPTNWWAPSLLCLGQLIIAAGFPNTGVRKLMSSPTKLSLCRGFAVGSKT